MTVQRLLSVPHDGSRCTAILLWPRVKVLNARDEVRASKPLCERLERSKNALVINHDIIMSRTFMKLGKIVGLCLHIGVVTGRWRSVACMNHILTLFAQESIRAAQTVSCQLFAIWCINLGIIRLDYR